MRQRRTRHPRPCATTVRPVRRPAHATRKAAMTTPAPDVAQRRTRVRQLADQGLSAREIARRLGVGKDTVRRDLAALTDGAPGGAASAHASAVPSAAPPAPPAHPAPAARAPGGATLRLDVDADLRDHLATLAEAGWTADEAVRYATELVADAVRRYWLYEQTAQPGSRPTLRIVHMPPADVTTPEDRLRYIARQLLIPYRPAPAARGTQP